jgi:hypothetical protein
MGDVVWVQCQSCGELHKIKQKDTSISDDDLYIRLHCPRCKDNTKHLWCGEDETEVYIYYNANLDPRYY